MSDNPDLVTLSDPLSPISEAYRTLRMNLQFAALDSPLRSLLITSATPGEGKSTTLANLAVTMAQVDQRVIMVDCDLRRPCLHTFFGLPNNVGLTNMMLEDQALDDPPLQSTRVPGLHLLASGNLPPRPPDLLGSERLERVIERLLAEADILIFDAPPVIAVPDAVVLSTKVDGVVLVLNAGETKREHAQHAVERLNRVNVRIVGAVLNNVPLDATLHRYYR
ncbi:MAG: capsular biosynthesis protein [Chloroflexi bacterium RBG_13_56_8]|nr:MAG: capsular biosynthesis protein [Chloroflexi bacterium RBG_13_56_8]